MIFLHCEEEGDKDLYAVQSICDSDSFFTNMKWRSTGSPVLLARGNVVRLQKNEEMSDGPSMEVGDVDLYLASIQSRVNGSSYRLGWAGKHGGGQVITKDPTADFAGSPDL